MSKPIHSYPWYVHDWRQSMTRLRLSPMGRYIYRELLDQCHIEGSLPNEPRLLAKISDVSLREFQKMWPEVSKAFELRDDGNLHHLKVDQVLQSIDKWREQKSKAGKASAQSRSTAVQRPFNVRSTAVQPSVADAADAASLAVAKATANAVAVAVVPTAQKKPAAAATPLSIEPPSPEPEPGRSALARSLVSGLMPAHPKPGNAALAVSVAERVLATSADPPRVTEAIRRTHAAWCEYWRTNPGTFRPMLHRWLQDGDYLHPPSRDATAGTQGKPKTQNVIDRMLAKAEEEEAAERDEDSDQQTASDPPGEPPVDVAALRRIT